MADEDGSIDWGMPDDEVHTFVNDLERPVVTLPSRISKSRLAYLYGRRMYEVMVAWEAMPLVGEPPFIRDFAKNWRAAGKIVYSRTLETVSSGLEADA